MQRIACYSTVVLISVAGLVGCSSGWSFANWRDALTFKKPFSKPTESVAELQLRAQQLEKLQEYDVAAAVYTEILRQDRNNHFAQQRLAAIRQRQQGATQQAYKPPQRGLSPVSRERDIRQAQGQKLPVINPGPPGTARTIAAREQSAIQLTAGAQHPMNEPGHSSLSDPPWARQAHPANSGNVAQNGKKRVPLDQLMARTSVDRPARPRPRNEVQNSGPINLPAVYDAQMIRESRNPASPSDVSQVAMTTILPEITQPQEPTPAAGDLTLVDVQKRLSTHPADPSAIEMLIQGIRTENRVGRWEIASTLGVLIQNPDSKALIVDSLSRALSDKDPEMRRNTMLVIASCGRNAQELLPALEQRLNDREESVRAAAAYAIKQIR